MPKPLCVIAEVGLGHNGDLGQALNLIDLVAELGGTALKFQTHHADSETVINAPRPAYFAQEDRHAFFKRTEFTQKQWTKIFRYAHEKQLQAYTSVFSITSLELVASSDVSGLKIPSGEITNHPLLKEVASAGKPVLLSTGMSPWHEIDQAVELLSEVKDLTIFQCTSLYPCPPERVGLNLLRSFARRYERPIGLSDHTQGIFATLAAITLGATKIEKHLTLSRYLYGPDSAHSLEPTEFKYLLEQVGLLQTALRSKVEKNDLSDLKDIRDTFQKKIVTAKDIVQDELIVEASVNLLKAPGGISADHLEKVLNKRAKRAILAGVVLSMNDLA
jgi:N-acetylneuraminate synthase